MSVPEYSAGGWTAVVRPGFVALLGPGAAESTVRALWQDAGEGVFAALALLARDGFGGLPPFAVVSVDGQRVHAALRGDVEVVVEVGGRQDVWRSGEVSTWTERVLDGVADVVVRVDGADDAAGSLPLADGVVTAGRVRVGLTVRDDDTVRSVAPAHRPEASAAVVDEPVADETAADETVTEVVDADETVADETVADETVADKTVADAPAPEESAADEPAEEQPAVVDLPAVAPEPEGSRLDEPLHDLPAWAGAAPAGGPQQGTPEPEIVDVVSWHQPATDAQGDPTGVVAAAESFLTAPTPTTTPAPAPTGPAPAGVSGASLDDHDGLTILSTDLAEIRDQLPSWASDEVPGPFRVPEPSVAEARLVLSTGLVVPLDRAVLLGRAPQVARVTNRELPRLITVPSPQQDISRTHAEVRLEGEHVVVTDLDSTNGIHVARTGEGARRLHPGEPSVVGADEVVDLGDGVTFSVERGS